MVVNDKYAQYAQYAEYVKYDLPVISCYLCTPPGTFMLYHSGVGLCIDFEKKKKPAEPDIIHPERKSVGRDSWLPDEKRPGNQSAAIS